MRMQPARLVVGPEAPEAPFRGRLVERLPVPLDHDYPASGRQSAADRVDHLAGIGDVVQGRRRDDGGDVDRRILEPLELDAAILAALGCLRIDAEGVFHGRQGRRRDHAAGGGQRIRGLGGDPGDRERRQNEHQRGLTNENRSQNVLSWILGRRTSEGNQLGRFEDRDGDGKFETHKHFLEGLNMATSVAFGNDGVWVLQSPHLLFYPDRNHDDVPQTFGPTIMMPVTPLSANVTGSPS